MRTIKRKVDVYITPSVGEVAKCIWGMDSDEQVFLLEELYRLAFKESKGGYLQLSYIADDVIKRKSQKDIGKLIDILHEYLGKQNYS